MIPIEIALLKQEYHRNESEGKLIDVNWKLKEATRKALGAFSMKYNLTMQEAFYIAFSIGFYELEGEL